MHRLQSYGADEPVFDNNAYTLGATDHDGMLKMYTTYITPPAGPGQLPEYHMSQTGAHALVGSRDQYLQGAAALRNRRDVTMEWRDQFISAANERARHAEPSTLESSNYNDVSDSTVAYPVEGSQTSEDELEEPEPSQDELSASFYPTATLFSYAVATSSLHYVEESGYDDLSDIAEELEISADELALDTPVKPTPSKRRPNKGSEKTVSKAPRNSTGTSHRKHLSKR
jgi:hypothetical protein